jgi:GAF domain-containing protein
MDEIAGALGVPEGLHALATLVLGDSDLDAVLRRTCEVTKATVPGAHEVSVTLTDHGEPRTAAFSGELALRVDESQYSTGQGPCLEAARTGQVITLNDLRADADRWPEYAPPAIEAGVRGSISVPLNVNEQVIGALNIYAVEPNAFEPAMVEGAVALAKYAGIVLSNADNYYRAASMADQLQQAMESRAVIEQAKGILMAQRRCNEVAAFSILVRLSQESHRKLRDVATALVEGVIDAE